MATIGRKRKFSSLEKEVPILQPPPYVIVVHGARKVGKSLLIKSLVKHYTNHIPTDDDGPFTVVLPEGRRIQFVECPNNVNGMIDAAKYADAVIFVIDISYGFEMETLEFVNLLKVHGMPKVIGVFTHLDCCICKDDASVEAKRTERFKGFFKKEIYEEAQIFCLSAPEKMLYPDHDISQLASFISGMEFHSLSWRAAAGSYVLVDGFEDATPTERLQTNTDCVRDVIFYGYLRGCDLKKKNVLRGSKVYIAGVGDFPLDFVTSSAEPRPSLHSNVTDPTMQIDITDHTDEGTTRLKSNIYRIGSYLMFKVCNVPSEMVDNRKPCQQPILIGDIYPRENQVVGQISATFERHSMHMKSLRTKDPIIVSVGWRRYLTTPTYGRENLDEILEFTPEDMKPCFAELWGPVVTPGTGFVAVQSLADNKAAFRILGTGEVLLFNSKMKPAGSMYSVRAPEPEPRDRVWKDGTKESEKREAHLLWGSLEKKIAPEHLRQSMSKIQEDKLELPCQKRKTDEHRRAVIIVERFSYRNSAEFNKAYQKQKEGDIHNNIPRGMVPRYFFKKKEIEQLTKEKKYGSQYCQNYGLGH